MSRILFLGTAVDASGMNSGRSCGGFVVQTPSCQFHVDPGPGALVGAAAFGINVREHTAVLVSSAEVQRMGDLAALLSAVSRHGLDPHAVVVGSKSVFQGLYDGVPRLVPFYRAFAEKSLVLEAGQKVGIEEVEVVALQVRQSDASSVGFRLTTPDFIVTYTGDTRFEKVLLKQYENTDILIVSTPFPFGVEGDGLSSEDVVKIALVVKPRLIIITHFGAKMVLANPVYEAREIQKRSGVQVIAAQEGLCVDPLSYAAEIRQTTLFRFEGKSQNQ